MTIDQSAGREERNGDGQKTCALNIKLYRSPYEGKTDMKKSQQSRDSLSEIIKDQEYVYIHSERERERDKCAVLPLSDTFCCHQTALHPRTSLLDDSMYCMITMAFFK